MAVHKGAIIRPAVIRGIRRPEFQVNLPPVQGVYFDLFGHRDQRRTIVIQADASVRASNQRSMVADSQAIVAGNIERDSDSWLIIPQAFEQLVFAAVRVTHPRQAMLDNFGVHLLRIEIQNIEANDERVNRAIEERFIADRGRQAAVIEADAERTKAQQVAVGVAENGRDAVFAYAIQQLPEIVDKVVGAFSGRQQNNNQGSG